MNAPKSQDLPSTSSNSPKQTGSAGSPAKGQLTLPIADDDFDRINKLFWSVTRLDMPLCLLIAQCRYYAGRSPDLKIPPALSRQLDEAIKRIPK